LSHCALIEEKMLKQQSVEGLELGEWDGQVAVDSLIDDIKSLDQILL
jgi:hypothetical protein